MKRKQIVICDSNEVYARRLQDYIGQQKMLSCKPEFYTDEKRFLQYIQSLNAPICVVSEDWLTQDDFQKVLEETAEQIVILSEEDNGADHSICRYRSADDFIKCLYELVNVKEYFTSEGMGIKRTKLIGVYTPIGRCLQTSFSLVLGQMLAAKQKVLYLNFESYSGFTQMMQKNFSADMADLLYFLKNLSQDFSQQFNNMKENINGLDYIPPAFSYMDISQVLPDEWVHFLKALEELGEYEYIILDLTDYVQGLYRILRSCTYVYTITRNEGMALSKLEHYENVLRELSYEDVLEKTKKCNFPIFRQLPMHAEDLIYSELAEYVRKVIREDFSNDG